MSDDFKNMSLVWIGGVAFDKALLKGFAHFHKSCCIQDVQGWFHCGSAFLTGKVGECVRNDIGFAWTVVDIKVKTLEVFRCTDETEVEFLH